MKAQINRWLAPPVFEGDEEKTWHASLLNTTTIFLIISIVVVFIGNLIGGRIPTVVIVINIIVFIGIFILRRLLFNGKVTLVSIAIIALGIIVTTASAASLGTIRTPTTAVFLFLIIISGFLLNKKGLMFSIVSSSLAVLGLILAENAGMLPHPDYTVNITQWVTYTIFFGFTGILTYYSYQSTIRALNRAFKESAERKRTEKVLKESEERYRSLIESSPVSMLVHSEGNLVFANPKAVKTMGAVSQEDFIGKPILDFLRSDYHDIAKKRMQDIYEKKESAEPIEEKLIRFDGKIIDVELAGSMIGYEGKPASQVVFIDITEKKKAEEELRESEQRLELALKGADLGLWDWNLVTGKVVREERWAEMLGYTIDEIDSEGLLLGNLIHPDDKDIVTKTWLNHFEGQTPFYETEHRVRHKSGNWIWILDRGRVFENDMDGNPIRVVGTQMDITDRKKAEESLRIRDAAMHSTISAIVLTEPKPKAKVTYVNPSTLKMWGYDDEKDVIGRIIFDFWQNKDEVQEVVNALIEKGSWNGEMVARKKDGSSFDAQVSTNVVLDDYRKPISIIASIIDITDRKRTEKVIWENEQRLKLVLQGANLGFWDLNLKAGTLTHNERFIEIVGYSKDELGNPPAWWEKSIHPDDKLSTVEALTAHIEGHTQLYNVEHRLLSKSGEYVWVNDIGKVVQYDEAGNPVRMTGTTNDITEKKLAEDVLANAAKEWEETFDAVDDMIAIIDNERNILRANRTMNETFGNKDIEEKKCYELFHGTDEPISFCPSKRTFETGELEHLELKEPHLDNRVFDVFTYPIKVEEGSTKKVVHVVRDITDRKKAEVKLKGYADDLKRANEDVKNFSYIVSHDLKAPLINIKGYSEKVNSAFGEISQFLTPFLHQLDESGRERFSHLVEEDMPKYMDFINLSTNRIGTLSNAILKLSRLGRRELIISTVEMDKIVKSSLQNLAHNVEEKGTTINVMELYNVEADWNSMQVIIDNLLNNAVNYLDPGRAGEIEIRAVEGKDETTFYIKDNGMGIAEADKKRIFHIFQRSGKQNVPGEGMGLAYVKTLVERHNGRIWCESEPGVGSTFIFTISKYLESGQMDK